MKQTQWEMLCTMYVLHDFRLSPASSEPVPAARETGMALRGAKPRPKADDSPSRDSAPSAATATCSRWKFLMAWQQPQNSLSRAVHLHLQGLQAQLAGRGHM